MPKDDGPVPKTFSFGGCDFGQTSPPLSKLSSNTSVLNVRISFEEALKLHLAIGECIRKLNSYKRSTAAGKRTALNLAIHLGKGRVTVNEAQLSIGSEIAQTKRHVKFQSEPAAQDAFGSEPSAVATRDSFHTVPMPSSKAELRAQATFNDDEFLAIKNGHIPEYDDKWFIYFEPRINQLSFHRTWTGFCIYQVKFIHISNGWQIVESWVNRDPEQYQSNDFAHDAAVLLWLIDVFLLGKDREFPTNAISDLVDKDLSDSEGNEI